MNRTVPREPSLDCSVALLREGYTFIATRCRKWNIDQFEARLLGERVVCMSGSEAAALFYDPNRFQRAGAIPGRVQRTLMGKGGVQTLDGDLHQQRKQLFMQTLSPVEVERLRLLFEQNWLEALEHWQSLPALRLFEETQLLLCRTACQWLGVPLDKERRRARDCGAMVDAFGGVGPRHWRGRIARVRTERWMRRVLPHLPPHAVASRFRETLEEKTAAVEVINLLRPIVAIATYLTFTALAIYRYGREGVPAQWFVEEVRRFYPFTPLLGARVRTPFHWKGYDFEAGQLVLLDVYGTNHDPRLWPEPDEFRPERFAREPGPFEFIPQGGGSPHSGHRCAGEAVTVELMKVGYDMLTRRMRYVVPEQDFSFSLKRMPTLPRSGFVIESVRRA